VSTSTRYQIRVTATAGRRPRLNFPRDLTDDELAWYRAHLLTGQELLEEGVVVHIGVASALEPGSAFAVGPDDVSVPCHPSAPPSLPRKWKWSNAPLRPPSRREELARATASLEREVVTLTARRDELLRECQELEKAQDRFVESLSSTRQFGARLRELSTGFLDRLGNFGGARPGPARGGE